MHGVVTFFHRRDAGGLERREAGDEGELFVYFADGRGPSSGRGVRSQRAASFKDALSAARQEIKQAGGCMVGVSPGRDGGFKVSIDVQAVGDYRPPTKAVALSLGKAPREVSMKTGTIDLDSHEHLLVPADKDAQGQLGGFLNGLEWMPADHAESILETLRRPGLAYRVDVLEERIAAAPSEAGSKPGVLVDMLKSAGLALSAGLISALLAFLLFQWATKEAPPPAPPEVVQKKEAPEVKMPRLTPEKLAALKEAAQAATVSGVDVPKEATFLSLRSVDEFLVLARLEIARLNSVIAPPGGPKEVAAALRGVGLESSHKALLAAFACEGFGQGQPEIRLAGVVERLELITGDCDAIPATEVDRALRELTTWLNEKAARPGGAVPKAPAKKKNSDGAGDQG